jgi:hypothetical protein
MEKIFENLGKLLFATFLAIITIIVEGFVFMQLWQWFTVPVFKVQPLTLVQSLGLILFLAYLKSKPKKKTEDDLSWENLVRNFINSLMLISLFLGAGYLINLFY